MDRDRKGESVAGVGAHDARGLRRTRRCERFAQGVQGEVKVRERRCRIGLRPKLRHELVPRDRALSIEKQQRKELLCLAGAPAPVADPRAAGSQLERSEDEGLDAFSDRR